MAWPSGRMPGYIVLSLLACVLIAENACSRLLVPSDQNLGDGSQGGTFQPAARTNLVPAGPAAPPFHDSQNLPAGTLLTVRLKNPVAATNSVTEASFEATVEEPVVVEGNTLIPRGSVAAGRVESAHSSQLKPNRGYVRLALASVRVGDVDVPMQTASLFARQSPGVDDSSPLTGLEKGRRLTFRVTEPVYITNQRAPAAH